MPNGALIAAILLTFVAVAHSYLGERYILLRLFRHTNLPHLFGSDLFTRHTVRFAWHVTTIAWLAIATMLLQTSAIGRSVPRAGVVIALSFLASALLGIIVTRARHIAWIIFVAIAVGAWTATVH